MRATATLNLFLGLPATRVHAIDFELDQIFGVVRLAQRRLRCPGCEFSTRANYDQPAQAVSVATPRRVRPTTAHTGFAPPIGAPPRPVDSEGVPFARPSARQTQRPRLRPHQRICPASRRNHGLGLAGGAQQRSRDIANHPDSCLQLTVRFGMPGVLGNGKPVGPGGRLGGWVPLRSRQFGFCQISPGQVCARQVRPR